MLSWLEEGTGEEKDAVVPSIAVIVQYLTLGVVEYFVTQTSVGSFAGWEMPLMSVKI